MKVEINKLPKSEMELKIEVPTGEWQEFLDGAAKELSKDLKIEGFRPGSAPLKLVEEKIGIAKILEEAAEHCIKKCYVKAVLDNNIEAIGQPEVSILPPTTFQDKEIGQADRPKSGEGLIFKAKVATMPEVKLPDYQKIASEVKRNKVLVEDREIEETLSWIRKSRARFSQKSGSSQRGDWIEIECSSGQVENGKKTDDAFILGEGHLISGFEENLAGMEAGQEKEFSLAFPENYIQYNWAGKNADFKVKMKSVKKVEFPEVNDEFAKTLGNFENLEALKKNIKDGVNLEKEQQESQRIRGVILEKIAQKSEMEIPEVLVERTKNQMLENLKQETTQRLGITFPDYLVKIKKTEKELQDSFFAEAEKRVKNSLVLREISKQEKIEVSDAEVKEETDKILKSLTLEKAKEIDLKILKNYTEDVLRNEKTLQFLEKFVKKS